MAQAVPEAGKTNWAAAAIAVVIFAGIAIALLMSSRGPDAVYIVVHGDVDHLTPTLASATVEFQGNNWYCFAEDPYGLLSDYDLMTADWTCNEVDQ